MAVARVSSADLRRALRPPRDGGSSGQDRGHSQPRHRERAVRHGGTRWSDQHHRQHDHRALRDGVPDLARTRLPARGTVLPAERPDVRQPPDSGDAKHLDPGSRGLERHHQLRQQLHRLRHRGRHDRRRRLLDIGQPVGRDGCHQSGEVHRDHCRRRGDHDDLRRCVRSHRGPPARTGQRVDGAPRAEAEPRPPRSGRAGGRPESDSPGLHPIPDRGRSCYRS